MPVQKEIDARGLACPQPVILTRKALAEAEEMVLTVLVDNGIAKENLLRLAAALGYDASARGEEPEMQVTIKKQLGDEDQGQEPLVEDCQLAEGVSGGLGVFITSEILGEGSDELGRLLMKSFLYALSERDVPPVKLALMNGGVRLAISESPALTDLKAMVAMGTQILVCGTCLDYFGLKEQLAVGQISNMYDIQEALLSVGQLLKP
jgi:selenium metabolism protein YedF